MSGPRPTSPSTFRLVAASAAAVASLGVVALGVQLGTHGLVGDGPGRNPGSASASPAAAVIDARTAPASAPTVSGGFETLEALSPAIGGGFGSAFGGASTTPSNGDLSAQPAPAPADGGSGGGAPPASPVPQVPPAALPPAPPVTVPSTPTPTVPPLLDPIVAPVVDVLTDATSAPAADDEQAPAAPTGNGGTLQGLVDSLLGR